jgi:hypothetical protein
MYYGVYNLILRILSFLQQFFCCPPNVSFYIITMFLIVCLFYPLNY